MCRRSPCFNAVPPNPKRGLARVKKTQHTGCFVKLYYPEADSAQVIAKIQGKSICYTPLHELEFISTDTRQKKLAAAMGLNLVTILIPRAESPADG